MPIPMRTQHHKCDWLTCWMFAWLVYVFILTPVFFMVLVNPKLISDKYVYILPFVWLISMILLSPTIWLTDHGHCVCRRQQADESREPVDVEQPPTIRVQFESARAQRQPYRSTSPPFEMRALPPVKTFIGQCAICKEEFKNGDTIQPFGVCVREFHSSCVQPWFNTGKTTCPLCREDLSTALKTKRHMDRIRI